MGGIIMNKFNQAFYTRDYKKGLGIYASSERMRDFTEKCSHFATRFRLEEVNTTSQFVVYSDEFRRYLGVGVSSIPYENGEGVRNVVHMFVPEQDANDATNIFLRYPYENHIDSKKKYQEVELSPIFDKSRLLLFLEKYNFTVGKLAYVIKMVFDTLLQGGVLGIVPSSQMVATYGLEEIALELQWIIAELVFATENQKLIKELSYSVNAKENIGMGRFAYTEDSSLCKNSLFLSEEDVKLDSNQIDLIYQVLAYNLVNSVEKYREAWRSLANSAFLKDRDWKKENLSMAYLSICIDNNYIVNKENLPLEIRQICRECRTSEETHKYLYRLIYSVDIEARDVKTIYDSFISYLLKDELEEAEYSEFIEFFIRIANLAFEQDHERFVKMFNEIAKKTAIRDAVLNKFISLREQDREYVIENICCMPLDVECKQWLAKNKIEYCLKLVEELKNYNIEKDRINIEKKKKIEEIYEKKIKQFILITENSKERIHELEQVRDKKISKLEEEKNKEIQRIIEEYENKKEEERKHFGKRIVEEDAIIEQEKAVTEKNIEKEKEDLEIECRKEIQDVESKQIDLLGRLSQIQDKLEQYGLSDIIDMNPETERKLDMDANEVENIQAEVDACVAENTQFEIPTNIVENMSTEMKAIDDSQMIEGNNMGQAIVFGDNNSMDYVDENDEYRNNSLPNRINQNSNIDQEAVQKENGKSKEGRGILDSIKYLKQRNNKKHNQEGR